MTARLERSPHRARARKSGRYTASPLCDACGKPCGTAYFTDDEVCGGTDGPGFFLYERRSCIVARSLPVEERRALYTRMRALQEN